MQEMTKINSISCPVCNNLCSAQAESCVKCGHPFNRTSTNQPFAVIFRIIAVISALVAGFCLLSLIIGVVKLIYGVEAWQRDFIEEGIKLRLILFIGFSILYAFFSFLVSISKRK